MTKAVAFRLFPQTGTRFRADELLSGSVLGRRTDRHFVTALTRVNPHSSSADKMLPMDLRFLHNVVEVLRRSV